MMKASLVKNHQNLYFDKDVSTYTTAAGSFTSKYSMQVSLSLDEFGGNERIEHRFDLNENEDSIGYDIIIGRDLMNKLNMDVRFSDHTIKYCDQLIPMKSFAKVLKKQYPSKKEIKATFMRSVEPKATQEETERVIKILDSNYKKADLEEVVDKADNLNDKQKEQLLLLLREFEELFDGTLGR